ncbi:sensor histidine kinase [Thalassospira lucentensis]|uniref:sensor histidine kinase n=1 Tax=Thalassospira lucentensis TaxID=168935 RepID=UPI0003B6D1E9|nr:ATP-binding protein [Thalassospira lucentensis]
MAKTKSFFAKISGRTVFAVLVLFLILYAVLSTSIVHKLEDERFTYRENFVWAVFQVQRQYLVLQRDIQAALAAPEVTEQAVENIMLGYELLVSRVFLLRDGDGFTVLFSVPEVTDLIATLEKQIVVIDDEIVVMSEPHERITELARLLEPLGDPLQQAVVRTTNFVSVYNTNNISGVKNDIETLSYLFFFGVFAMGLLGLFMIRQRQRAFAADIAAQKARQEQEVIEEAADYAKMHALGTLAGGVAHEINTPAQYIQNNLEFLSDSFADLMGAIKRDNPADDARLDLDKGKIDFLTAEVPMAIDESIQGLDRIAEIVRGIRKFAHPATDIVERISITEEIDTAITLTRNEVKHIADLEVGMQTDVTEINGRRNHLSQALINLIVNASQAIKETGQRRGRIDLVVKSDDRNVYIHVRDNGGGVPDAVRDRIFDYFFTTKERGVGTGQGLPICRKFIQDDFNGDLTLSDDYHGGAEFVIRLPKPDQDDAVSRQADHEGPGDLSALLG